MTRRVVVLGLMAGALSVAANIVIRQIAIGLFDVDEDFWHLEWRDFILSTIGGVVLAVVFLLIVIRKAEDPFGLFFKVAVAALVLSLAGPISIALGDDPAHDWGSALTLAAMHVATAVITIGLLMRARNAPQD